MTTIAVAIICKTPSPGKSKTRLSPLLPPEDCAEISGCFIADLAATIAGLSEGGDAPGYAVYTPVGSEEELQHLLPDGFGLVPQGEGDLGRRLDQGITDLLAQGHAGAILVNSDSPTLPRHILRAAVQALKSGDNAVISPALDGGYTLIGLSQPHPELFVDIPWSTDTVYSLTLERARRIGVPVISLDPWYDVDDARSYAMLEDELDGRPPPFSIPGQPVQEASRTRAFVRRRQRVLAS